MHLSFKVQKQKLLKSRLGKSWKSKQKVLDKHLDMIKPIIKLLLCAQFKAYRLALLSFKIKLTLNCCSYKQDSNHGPQVSEATAPLTEPPPPPLPVEFFFLP